MGKKIADRRVRRTRELLQSALAALIVERGYDAVTVQDVLDRANVGRSTFYAHFRDKEDLLLSGAENLWTQFEEHFASAAVTNETPWMLSLSMFEHAAEQRSLYRALSAKKGGNIALQHIQKKLYVSVRDHLKAQAPKRKKGFPPDLLAHYIISSFIALLTWWLDNDASYTPAQMNDFYRQLVQPGVEAIFPARA